MLYFYRRRGAMHFGLVSWDMMAFSLLPISGFGMQRCSTKICAFFVVTKGVMLDLPTVRLQDSEADAYRRLISWSAKAIRCLKED